MKHIKNTCFFLLTLLVMFFCLIPIGVHHIFGDVELESIIFHIFMPRIAMGLDWLMTLSWYMGACLIATVVIYYIYRRFKKARIPLLISLLFVFVFDAVYLEKHFAAGQYLANQRRSSLFIKQHYVSPDEVTLRFPQQKRNLIFIQVESLESSLQNKKNGGLFQTNYIPELTALAKNNINFSSTKKVGGAIVLPGAGWTMAGLVAETTGIPLKTYKTHNSEKQIGNHFDEYKSFLSQAVSLGDILQAAGYKNYFILGSSADFAAQGIFLKEHGSYKIYDLDVIAATMSVQKPDAKWWGLLDQDLYAFAKKKLSRWAKKSQPFSVIIQTIDSHGSGFLSADCPKRYGQNIKNVYACVSKQLNDFITWCMQQDFFKNTTIVVVGDHCNMSKTFLTDNINPETGYYEGTKRKVYNVFINAALQPQKEKKRLFSTFDIFPTTLAALGVEIEGDRLGLGTNLFSEKQTLLEQYGYPHVAKELRKKSNFYNTHLLYPKHTLKMIIAVE